MILVSQILETQSQWIKAQQFDFHVMSINIQVRPMIIILHQNALAMRIFYPKSNMPIKAEIIMVLETSKKPKLQMFT